MWSERLGLSESLFRVLCLDRWEELTLVVRKCLVLLVCISVSGGECTV